MLVGMVRVANMSMKVLIKMVCLCLFAEVCLCLFVCMCVCVCVCVWQSVCCLSEWPCLWKKWTLEILFFSLSYTHTATHTHNLVQMHFLVLLFLWGLSKTKSSISQRCTLTLPNNSLILTLTLNQSNQTVLWIARDHPRWPHFLQKCPLLC